MKLLLFMIKTKKKIKMKLIITDNQKLSLEILLAVKLEITMLSRFDLISTDLILKETKMLIMNKERLLQK